MSAPQAKAEGIGAAWMKAGMMLAVALALFALYLIVFILKRQLSPHGIIFYEGVVLIAIMAIAYSLIWTVLAWGSNGRRFFGAGPQAIVTFVFIAYGFHITIPSLLDRSFSIYAIAAIAAAGDQGVTRTDMKRWFVDDFLNRADALDRRLNEQVASGNLRRQGERYVATGRGLFISDLNLVLSQLFATDPRYVRRRGPGAGQGN